MMVEGPQSRTLGDLSKEGYKPLSISFTFVFPKNELVKMTIDSYEYFKVKKGYKNRMN